MKQGNTIQFSESSIAHFLFNDTRMAVLWLVVRVYLGYEWLSAGIGKLLDPGQVWVGANSGTALKGFLMGALQKASGAHPDVSGWYASFIQNFALAHTTLFSHLVTYGEILVGVGLIIGFVTGVSAFFGCFMNMNYLLAGTVSVNPIWLIVGFLLMKAWRTAGWYGADRFVLPIWIERVWPGRCTKK